MAFDKIIDYVFISYQMMNLLLSENGIDYLIHASLNLNQLRRS